ncbi:MAG TPA: cytochrome c oxidase subunit II [Solirubrobacteraceae bacterium]|nr:cytochrome c oxidase subunit II [Solirubrobacteraceae bacterium]
MIPAVGAAAAGWLAFAPSAFANFITPKSGGSPNANSIWTLYFIVLIVAAVVFVAVEAALVYAVFKFRAKKHPVARQIHGNTPLEIGWTAAAALILLILAVVTFIKLPSIVNPPNTKADGLSLSASVTEPNPPNGQKLRICVQGRQYIWRYTYGQNCLKNAYAAHDPYSYTTMVVPVHTTVVLAIQSLDVIHSWWVPAMGGKVDAVPGNTTYTWFQATHLGKFRGQCAQLCGWNHDAMDAYVDVVTPAQYRAWLAQQARTIRAQNSQVSQLRSILTSENQLGS